MVYFELEHCQRLECPLCRHPANKSVSYGPLALSEYRFGGARVLWKNNFGPGEIIKCCVCGLFYKNIIPHPASLNELFASCLKNVWRKQFEYIHEVSLVESLFPSKKPSVLDVGAGSGGFLSTIRNQVSRLSALDVVMNPKCCEYISGEYIIGALDDPALSWSGRCYDLTTGFDVVEHLYDVDVGFLNLFNFLKKDGYCILETGNAMNPFVSNYGINEWWYINRIEHHEAYSLQSLEYIAAKTGFRIVSVNKKRHKDKIYMKASKNIKICIKSLAYQASPFFYMKFAKHLNLNKIQPFPVFEKDHLLIVLQKL